MINTNQLSLACFIHNLSIGPGHGMGWISFPWFRLILEHSGINNGKTRTRKEKGKQPWIWWAWSLVFEKKIMVSRKCKSSNKQSYKQRSHQEIHGIRAVYSCLSLQEKKVGFWLNWQIERGGNSTRADKETRTLQKKREKVYHQLKEKQKKRSSFIYGEEEQHI